MATLAQNPSRSLAKRSSKSKTETKINSSKVQRNTLIASQETQVANPAQKVQRNAIIVPQETQVALPAQKVEHNAIIAPQKNRWPSGPKRFSAMLL